jgi:thiamine-phosphate pyrophosphorylase
VFPPLYAIIDSTLLKTSELAFAEMMAESGVEILQYRSKHATSREQFDVSVRLSAHCATLSQKYSRVLRFIVNDRPDIAMLAGASGVHVGQTDLPVEYARAIVGVGKWVGVSTHNLEQVAKADKTSADYIAFGPIYATATKEAHDPVVGLTLLAQARALTGKPLVAIGGITLERAEDVYRAGADSLAVTRDLIAAREPAARAREFLHLAARIREGGAAAQ